MCTKKLNSACINVDYGVVYSAVPKGVIFQNSN